MKWVKRGRILSPDLCEIEWYKKYTLVPVPHLINERTLRVFVTMCDDANIGRIGYVDLDPQDPQRILAVSKTPIIDVGLPGRFDDHGVVTSSILVDGDKLYLYYSGYQLCVDVPYMIFSGVAVSRDNGLTFSKLSTDVPMLDRVPSEISTRCAPYVLKEGDQYRMWYTSDHGCGWTVRQGKKIPLYDLKHSVSSSPVHWPSHAGQSSIGFLNEDEHGIAKSTIWKDNSTYKIIYSIRSFSQGYRLGYGESEDGVVFRRMDSDLGLDVSESGWDCEMIAFAERIKVGDRVYLFYSGNRYGSDGFGFAEQVR